MIAVEDTFPKHWVDGTNPDEPQLQVHRYAEHTWILRQSVLTDFEGPFLYLFVGQERGLLVDTGAGGGVPLRGTIDHLIGTGFPLVVAHSHAHRDHVADDAQFIDRPDTTIVAHGPEDVAHFFGINDWPVGTGRLDLGGRHLDVIPIPGHEPARKARKRWPADTHHLCCSRDRHLLWPKDIQPSGTCAELACLRM